MPSALLRNRRSVFGSAEQRRYAEEKNRIERTRSHMKVKELQERLDALDPELEIVCYSEDQDLLAEGRGFVLLNIADLNTTNAERMRLDDGTPYLKLGDGPHSSTIATLEVTTAF
jgi:hypothetical protein